MKKSEETLNYFRSSFIFCDRVTHSKQLSQKGGESIFQEYGQLSM